MLPSRIVFTACHLWATSQEWRAIPMRSHRIVLLSLACLTLECQDYRAVTNTIKQPQVTALGGHEIVVLGIIRGRSAQFNCA
jgi:hypothetical protein